jgi:sugar phosphate isomerase/epimerase
MRRMYICLNGTTAGGGLPTEQFVALAAETGFPGADVNLGYAVQKGGAGALRDLFARHKLRFGGWGIPFDWRDPAKHADGMTTFDRHAAIASELRIDSCCTWLIPSSDRPFIENWNWHVKQLVPVAQVLAEHGLRLGLEFIGPYHLRRHGRHEFIFTAGQMLELADAIGTNVGLLVDSYHCHTSGEPWEHLAEIPGDRIVLAHLNDAPDLPLHQLKDGERLLPGEGVLDLKAFVAALKAAGYDGPISVEVFSPDLKTRGSTTRRRRPRSPIACPT